jgi:hypothetical protein
MYRYLLPLLLALACGQSAATRCAGQFQPHIPAGVQAAMPAVFAAQMQPATQLSMPYPQQASHVVMASVNANHAFQQAADREVSNSFEGQSAGGKFVSLNFVGGDSHESVAQYDAPPATEQVMPGPVPIESFDSSSLTSSTAGCIPDCRHGALHILSYPGVLAQIDCCPDNSTGNCDRHIRRFFDYNVAVRSCRDPKCLICVQEPFICEKVCMEDQEVVFFRCYQKCEPYSNARCEDQRCIQEVGQRTVKKLDPCKAKIKVPIKKIAVEYRKVWICIDCPPVDPGMEPQRQMQM